MAKNCNGCNTENQNFIVPYVVHEATVARQERQNKRLWIALIVAVALMFLTNMVWVAVFSSYDYSSEEYIYTQDGQGTNIMGDGNEVDNGAEIDNSQAQEN